MATATHFRFGKRISQRKLLEGEIGMGWGEPAGAAAGYSLNVRKAEITGNTPADDQPSESVTIDMSEADADRFVAFVTRMKAEHAESKGS